MRILWIVNTIFPYPAKQIGIEKNELGGWLIGLSNQLVKNENIELAIATVYKGRDIKEMNDGRITYYLIPGAPAIKYQKRIEQYWKEINEKFNPDLVHIHGTEFAHGLAFKNACPNKKVITSIQGMVSEISKVYYADISIKEIIKNITLRDIAKLDTIINEKNSFKNRGKNEIDLIRKSDIILGRTSWDYETVKKIKNDVKYEVSNEILRPEFYNSSWDIENVEKHTIFMSQATYPIKGLHKALEVIVRLKDKYPDVILYVAGLDITKRGILTSGYGKYIKKLIEKYNLEENIIFTGILNSKEMVSRLLKSNVFLLASALENSSNSLCEAMILGMPCVATNTGGTKDMLAHGKEGYLYSYNDVESCFKYVSDFFENDELCIKHGEKAQKTAKDRHDEAKNVNNLINIYNEVIEEK